MFRLFRCRFTLSRIRYRKKIIRNTARVYIIQYIIIYNIYYYGDTRRVSIIFVTVLLYISGAIENLKGEYVRRV